MHQSIVSSKYQVVIPYAVREQAHVSKGQRMTFLVKGDIIALVPDRPLSSVKGIARGLPAGVLREKKDRSL